MAVLSPTIVVPTGAGPTKLVLLSSVVVVLPSGRFTMVAAAPSVSAKAMTAPPCRMSGRVQSSGRTTISAFTPCSLAATNLMPRTLAKGSWRSFRNWVLSIVYSLSGGLEPAQAEILQNGQVGHDQRDHDDARNAQRRPRGRQHQRHRAAQHP